MVENKTRARGFSRFCFSIQPIIMGNQTKWSIDQAHITIGFKVKHLMISHVRGSFATFDGSIYTIDKNFSTAQIDFWIDTSSITTGDAKRDEHLKSADFFDVEKYKEITFISSTIEKVDKNGIYDLWGELTMMGITKNIQLEVKFGGIIKDPWNNEKAGFTVSGKISRSEWGLVWNTIIETNKVLVSDEISILCEVQLTNIGFKGLNMELVGDNNSVLNIT